jgi:hypothetical protein
MDDLLLCQIILQFFNFTPIQSAYVILKSVYFTCSIIYDLDCQHKETPIICILLHVSFLPCSFMLKRCVSVIFLNQLLQLENGQSGAIVMASNSSDRSDRSDKPMDQKVLTYSFVLLCLFSVLTIFL